MFEMLVFLLKKECSFFLLSHERKLNDIVSQKNNLGDRGEVIREARLIIARCCLVVTAMRNRIFVVWVLLMLL